MSYDLEHIQKACPCPCGRGRIVYGWGTNDWNQIKEDMIEIECLECNHNYKITPDGLLPKDYPDYQGDPSVAEEMGRLQELVSNYCGSIGIRYWSKELKEKRFHLYLTDEEIKEDEIKGSSDNYYMAFSFAHSLARKYSIDSLMDVQKQLLESKSSKALTGEALFIAAWYQRQFKSIKMSNAIKPVKMAIRNYEYYKEADREDEEYISQKKERLKALEAVYFKGYDEYEKDRQKHIVKYELLPV